MVSVDTSWLGGGRSTKRKAKWKFRRQGFLRDRVCRKECEDMRFVCLDEEQICDGCRNKMSTKIFRDKAACDVGFIRSDHLNDLHNYVK